VKAVKAVAETDDITLIPPSAAQKNSIVQKIKLLRKTNGISQEELGMVAMTNQAKISRAENGSEGYNKKELGLIKEYLDIVGMPLAEDERAPFRRSLYFWRDLIRNGRMDEANKWHKKLSPAINLEPCDPDLATLYRLIEVIHMLAKNDLEAAEKQLNLIYSKLDHSNIEHLYYYNFNMGTLYTMRSDYEGALKFYMKALEIREKRGNVSFESNGWLYHNIALCHSGLESPFKALSFLNKIPRANPEDRMTAHGVGVDILFAINYIKVGELESAEGILNECLINAKGMNDDFYIGLTLHNLGIFHRRNENWEKAIDYFDQTMDILDENSNYYLWALYYKARCLIESRKFSEAERVIKQIQPFLDEGNEFASTLCEILRQIIIISRRMSVYNKGPAHYIEDVAVPFLVKHGVRLEAISCCELLVKHCIRTKREGKAFAAKAAIGDIYKWMFNEKMVL